MLPKVIHYCWFGGSPFPELIGECIDSWKRLLPDYEIIEWNEKNADLDCDFAKKALNAKNWAFVSDYVRLVALYHYGGIYLDTDMMLIKPLDPLLKHTCFLGFENTDTVNAAIIGAEPRHEFIQKAIKHYQSITFDENHLTPIPNVLTYLLNEYAPVKYHDYPIQHELATLFPVDFFYPLPYYEDPQDYLSYVNEETYAVHLWNHSWANEFTYFWQGDYRMAIQKVWLRFRRSPIQPINYYKDLFYHLRRILIK